jgi:hypothetical protein
MTDRLTQLKRFLTTCNATRLIACVMLWGGFWRLMNAWQQVGVMASAHWLPVWVYGLCQFGTGIWLWWLEIPRGWRRRRRIGYAVAAMFSAWLGLDLLFASSFGAGGYFLIFTWALLVRAAGHDC